MRTRLLVIGLLIGIAGSAHGMGGNLERPGIAIPTDATTKGHDPVAKKLHDALTARQKDFAGGSFINAHTTLYYAGGADGVNALMRDLAAVDRATVRVRLAREAGEARLTFPSAKPVKPCDCKVEHNGWGDARVVTLTVFLGSLDADKLELPAVSGRGGKKLEGCRAMTPWSRPLPNGSVMRGSAGSPAPRRGVRVRSVEPRPAIPPRWSLPPGRVRDRTPAPPTSPLEGW